MKKELIALGLLFLVVASIVAVAQAEEQSSPCDGFWGSLSCFLFGNPENRAGRSWFDRGNVVGGAYTPSPGQAIEILPQSDAEQIVRASGLQGMHRNDDGSYRRDRYIGKYYPQTDGTIFYEGGLGPRNTPLLSSTYIPSRSMWDNQQQAPKNLIPIPPPIMRTYIITTIDGESIPIEASSQREAESIFADENPTQQLGHVEEGEPLNSPAATSAPAATPMPATPSTSTSPSSDTPASSPAPAPPTTAAASPTPTSGTPTSTPATPAPTPRQPTPEETATARARMGESIFNKYKDQIVWAADTTTSENYNLRDGLGTITTSQRGNYYITTVAVNNPPAAGADAGASRTPDNSLSQTVIISNGNPIASQSVQQRESHQITLITPRGDDNDIHTESVYLREGTDIDAIISAEERVTDNLYYASATDANRRSNPQGRIQVESEQYIHTNFEDEIQTIIHTGGEGGHEELTGDYDRSRREADRFIPSSGKEYDAHGNQVALLDYDYGDADKRNTLQQVERFSPVDGKRNGIDIPQGDSGLTTIRSEVGRTILQQDGTTKDVDQNYQPQEGERVTREYYNGRYIIVQPDGTSIRVRQNEDGQWEEQQDGEWKPLDSSRKSLIPQLDDVRDTTVGFAAQAQTTLLSIYAFTQSVKDYPALSNLFYGNQDWYKDQQRFSDQFFAPMLGNNWFPSAFCEGNYDIEPEGTAVIKTASGTYQASAHIEMERSERKSPMLCERNQDPEAEQEWRCSRGQVCVDGNFCYLDANNDGEADQDTPLEGYFYKITWGVTAPSDEAFTPFRDENGVAVSFNVWLDTAANGFKDAGALPLYNKDGSTLDPIELKNGGRDSDVYIHYSPNLLTEACIHWGKAPATTRSFSGTRTIGDVCFEVDVSSVGEVNWGRSGRQAPSPTVSGGQVSRNSDW